MEMRVIRSSKTTSVMATRSVMTRLTRVRRRTRAVTYSQARAVTVSGGDDISAVAGLETALPARLRPSSVTAARNLLGESVS